MYRIGQSSDIHQLVEGRKLVLGGVVIEHYKGLLGHSDADCLLHSIIESIIGALGLGDIGTHFPDTDIRYKDIDSKVLLVKVYELLLNYNYSIVNIDSTIMIEKPIMSPYIGNMRENIASILDIDIGLVNIKATTGESLGFIGEELGVMASSVVLLKSN